MEKRRRCAGRSLKRHVVKVRHGRRPLMRLEEDPQPLRTPSAHIKSLVGLNMTADSSVGTSPRPPIGPHPPHS
eukprot:49887-Chlamydomonas_euryale.AAC.3